MSDALVIRVLADRDGLDLNGSVVHLQYIHRHAYADTPVLDMLRRHIREEVARYADEHGHPITGADVELSEVSPEELGAAWREHAPMDVPPLTNAHALLGHWAPGAAPSGS